MGQFATVVRVLIGTVWDRWHRLPHCGRIALEFVSHHAPGRCALALEQLAEEAFGCALVAAFLDQNVNGIAVLVNGSPQILQLAANCDEHFIEKPGIAQLASPLFQLASVIQAKSVAPVSNRFSSEIINHADFFVSSLLSQPPRCRRSAGGAWNRGYWRIDSWGQSDNFKIVSVKGNGSRLCRIGSGYL